jgi:hypothetical protein
MGASAAPVGTPAGPTAQFPAHGYAPPARQAPSAPPMPAYPPGPIQPGAGYGPQPTVYTVPSIGLMGAGLVGAAISAAFTLVPCLIFAWFITVLVGAARGVLDALARASLRIPIPIASVDVPVNYVDLFQLRGLYDSVVSLDNQIWLAFMTLFGIPWLIFIVCGGLCGITLALIYNSVGAASGGMRVKLVPVRQGPAGPPAAWQPPGPPTNAPPAWPNQGWPPEPRR